MIGTAFQVVRATVLQERLAREGIDLGLDDRHRAPRTAGDNRVLSTQPDSETVAGLGAIPKLEVVVRDLLHPDAVLQVVDSARRNNGERRLCKPTVRPGGGHSIV